jgi:hypothetical protein
MHPERSSQYISSTAAPSKNGWRAVPRNWKKCGPRWMRKELTILKQVGEQVDDDGLHAHHDQGEGPLLETFDLISQLKPARSRKHAPPLASVQLGVQTPFKTGQSWIKCSRRPAAALAPL